MSSKLQLTVNRLLVLLIFIGLTLSYMRMKKLIRSDGVNYYIQLRSLVIDGDLHYANEYANFDVNKPRGYVEGFRTKTDHVPNKYFIGPCLFWLPFFLIAHILTLLLNTLGVPLPADGFSILYHFFVASGSIFYGLVGLFLINKFLRLYFSKVASWLATLIVLLGTNVIYYITTEPTMSHAMSLFAVSIFIYWSQTKKSKRYYWFHIGLMVGLMTLIRPQNILFSIVLLPQVIQLIRTKPIGSLSLFGQAILGLVLLFIPQLAVWQVVFGEFFTYSYKGESFDFTNPQLYNVLFSAKHGLIYWTPIVGIALIGLICSSQKIKTVPLLLLLAFLLQYFLNASWHSWWFAYSYGNRGFVNCSLIFAFGIAFLFEYWISRKWILYFTMALLVIHNLLFYLAFSLNFYAGDEPVTIIEAVSTYWQAIGALVQRIIELF